MDKLCAGCDKVGVTRCSRCHKVGVETFYCGSVCQTIMWTTHKNHCKVPQTTFTHPPIAPGELSLFAATAKGLSQQYDLSIVLHALSPNFLSQMPKMIGAGGNATVDIVTVFEGLSKGWPLWEKEFNALAMRVTLQTTLQSQLASVESKSTRQYIAYSQLPIFTYEGMLSDPPRFSLAIAKFLHAHLHLFTVMEFRTAEAESGRYHGEFPSSLLKRVEVEVNLLAGSRRTAFSLAINQAFKLLTIRVETFAKSLKV